MLPQKGVPVFVKETGESEAEVQRHHGGVEISRGTRPAKDRRDEVDSGGREKTQRTFEENG
jgi:hypothetical protein